MVWPSICFVTSKQHVDLALLRIALDHTLQHAPHPARAFAAWRALAAAFVLEEGRDAGNRLDDVGGLVHDDHAAGAEEDFTSRMPSKSMIASFMSSPRTMGQDAPPG